LLGGLRGGNGADGRDHEKAGYASKAKHFREFGSLDAYDYSTLPGFPRAFV